MAKRSGLGSNFYVGVFDISGDVGALSSLETMRGEQDVTGICADLGEFEVAVITTATLPPQRHFELARGHDLTPYDAS